MARRIEAQVENARLIVEYYQELSGTAENDLQKTVVELVADLQHLLCQEATNLDCVFNLNATPQHSERPEAQSGWNNTETELVGRWLSREPTLLEIFRTFASECLVSACGEHSFGNDVWTAFDVARLYLAGRLRGYIESGLEPSSVTLYSDLLREAVAKVDWQQLAESLLKKESGA